MNQQIQALALKCGAWHQVYGNRTFMIDEHFDIEKFTLLIVRDCVMMADMYADELLRTKPSDHIKKHFGVAE